MENSQNQTFDGSDFWPGSHLETDEKLPSKKRANRAPPNEPTWIGGGQKFTGFRDIEQKNKKAKIL